MTETGNDTRPWVSQFSVSDITIVEETDQLRVLHMTLAPGEFVPWHWHSEINDRFYCLSGCVEIESRAPKALHHLEPGDDCVMPPKVAHEVRNISDGNSQLLLVQGVGLYDYHPVGG